MRERGMSHANPAGGADAGAESMAISGAAVDAAGVVNIVVSCPEQGSVNADGSPPYDQAVMTKLIELQAGSVSPSCVLIEAIIAPCMILPLANSCVNRGNIENPAFPLAAG